MWKFVGGLFKVVSMLPVVSPPFVLSLSMIMLFGKEGIIRLQIVFLNNEHTQGNAQQHHGHGRRPLLFWCIVIVQTLTFFPVCYMMLKGLLKNIDPPESTGGSAGQ